MASKEQIVRDLRNEIISGKLMPGEHITEKTISLQFSVSRTPAREALRQLEKEGMVNIYPNVGARVADFSVKTVTNLYDMLAFLDGAAARLACLHVGEQDIIKLRECQFMIEKAASEKNRDLLSELNSKFHFLITELSGNHFLTEIRKTYSVLTYRCAPFFTHVPHFFKAVVEEHPKIIDAIENKNAGLAEFLARDHMEGAKQNAVNHFPDVQKGGENEEISGHLITLGGTKKD